MQDWKMPCTFVRHFPVLHFPVLQIQSPPSEPQRRRSSPRRIPPKFGWNRGGVAVLSRKPAISRKRGKLGPRLLLMNNRKSHIRPFDWCQNQRPWMTLNGHYAFGFKTRTYFGAHHENLNEDRPIVSATTM